MRVATILVFLLIAAACGSSADNPPDRPAPATTTSISEGAAPESTVAPSTPDRDEPTTTSTPQPTVASTSSSPEPIPAESATGAIGEGTIGYVGCSVSQNAVAGYGRILGGTRMWSGGQPYGGGSIGRWEREIDAGRSRYWSGFDEALTDHPDTSAIWYSLCTIRGAPGDSVEAATAVIAEVRDRLPGIPVFVSAQPPYSDGHVCDLAGETGPQQMADVAAELVRLGMAEPGPVMGPLAESETGDGCHANEIGQEKMGRQLLEFFG